MGFLSKLSSLSLATFAVVNAAEILSVSNQKDVIPNNFIIMMKKDISSDAFDAHKEWVSSIHLENSTRMDAGFDGTAKHTYSLMKGYSGQFDEHAIQEIAGHDDVCIPSYNVVVRR